MKTLLSFLVAITITNTIFVFLLHEALKKHEEVIDRHGIILTLMLQTPEIKAVLDNKLQTVASSTPEAVTR